MAKFFFAAIAALVVAAANAQQAGKNTPESPLPFSIQKCTKSGGCQSESGTIVLDSNWRWTHHVDDYVNCYTGNEWDQSFCPDPKTCAENCAVDGVSSSDWSDTYGIRVSGGNELSLTFKTEGQFSTNIGSRVYLLSGSEYRMFNLLNQEFTFTADSSALDCGLNGALYFVEMDPDGGLSEFPENKAGAKFGTGYCDAQCPHDMKWINGVANVIDWTPSDNDANAGFGKYGTCCAEMDLWEANSKSQAYTSHPCDVTGPTQCEGTDCGDGDQRYDGVCDKDGCDFASYRLGDKNFYGAGSGFAVDSSKPVTVVTQFISSNGQDNGDLVEIRRLYVQDGQVIENSKVNIDGVDAYDSLTEEMCEETKAVFGDEDDHARKGGLKAMGEALKRGMVLTMSLWDDHVSNMLWLDSNFPTDADPNTPGVARGPCPTSSGKPEDVENSQGDATVKFSDIRIGEIGSTY